MNGAVFSATSSSALRLKQELHKVTVLGGGVVICCSQLLAKLLADTD